MNAPSIASVRKDLAALIDRVRYRKERVIITRHDEPVAALVPVDDATLLDKLEGIASTSPTRWRPLRTTKRTGASVSAASKSSSIANH